jgi:hypothetical protein
MCHGDDAETAADLAEAMELSASTCSQLDCTLPSVAATCKETCKHSDYFHEDHVDSEVALPAFEAHYAVRRRLLRLGLAFGRDRRLEERMLAKVREGVDDVSYTPVYGLHSKASIRSALDAFYAKTVLDINATFPDHAYECNAVVPDEEPSFVCDPKTVMREVEEAELEWSCTKREGFTTQSYSFCPWVNIDVPSSAALAEESCYLNQGREGFDDDGADSNAICAPRETCEALCLSMDDCIGVDMVIGQHRCFLNKKYDEFCSEDTVYEGTGALTPPVGWFHPAGFGLTAGMRYADGHIPSRARRLARPARRLAGEKLWSSDSHLFLRRIDGQDMVWATTSDRYCRGNNVNISAINASLLCSNQCAGDECKDLELDSMDTADFAVCGYTREECEDLCAGIPECIGFDMHKTKERCWLNKATCGVETTKDADDHDLVTKEFADACQVEITGAGDADGIYVQTENISKFTRSAGYVLEKNVAGCYWTVADAESLVPKYVVAWENDHSVNYTLGKGYCDELMLLPDGKTWKGWNNGTTLHHATCKDEEIDVSFHCIEDETCQPYQYCLLSTERLSFELDKLRGDEDADLTVPMCEVAGLHPFNISERIHSYKPKTIADTTRAEAVIDTTGHEAGPDIDNVYAGGHFLNHEIFRDGNDFRIRLQRLGEEFVQGIVTLVDPVASIQELGGTFPPPAGYKDFQTDLIRMERYNASGHSIYDGAIEFDFYSTADDAKDLTWFALNETGPFGRFWFDVSETVEMTVQSMHHEPGWYKVKFEIADLGLVSGCSLLLAATTEIDECDLGHTCEENAVCVNTEGGPGYTCECKPGWRATADGQCIATTWSPDKMVVRVENDVAFDMGWRIQEIELFNDANCNSQMIINNRWDQKGLASSGVPDGGHEGWYWAHLDDTYCAGNNYVPAAAESARCSKKCSARTSTGDCSGYNKVDATSMAICAERNWCMFWCASDPDCIGFDMHEYLPRCYINKAGKTTGASCSEQVADATLRKDDVNYELWLKQKVVNVNASSAFDEHPATLVNDQSMNSEWWSGSFRRARMTEYLDFEVAAFAPVSSVKVHQRPDKSISAYRVHVGPAYRARFGSSLDAGGKHVQHAESGGQIEDRTQFTRSVVVSDVSPGETPCVTLTCGEPLLFWSPDTLLQSYQVPSACHCKQLCLDHVDEGCRSWMYYDEKDTNYWTDAAFHHHKTCNLHTSRMESHKTKATVFAVSGGVDLVLLGVEPSVAPVGPFDLTVKGAGLPSQTTKQRIKVVEEDCDEEPVAEVLGISCSSPYVCHPQPAKADSDTATWRVELLKPSVASTYKVCYCAGVCYSKGQWTLVPGTIKTAAASRIHSLSVNSLTAQSAAFKIFISPDLKAGQKILNISLVPAYEKDVDGLSCSENTYLTSTADKLFTFTKEDATTYEATIKDATYGNYTVCVQIDDEWVYLPSAKSPYLTLTPSDADAVRTAGIFRNAGSWSVRTGTTVNIGLSGSQLTWANYDTSRIAIAAKGKTCGDGEYTEPAQYALSATESLSSDTELVFEMTVPTSAQVGKFTICFCKDADDGDATPKFANTTVASGVVTLSPDHDADCGFTEVAGELIVTRRVDTGKNYVLDPDSSEMGQASVEITGTDLDHRKDRIMVVNCQDTCGRADASEYAYAATPWPEVVAVNTKDYSGDVTVEEPYTVDGLYTTIEDRYCRGHNLGSPSTTELVKTNLCYDKCKDGCTGDACFCGGYYQGFDTEESTALCLPQVECEHLCTLLGDACWGVDMHKTNPRCFLNGPVGGGCQDQVQALTPGEGLGYDTSYNLLQKSAGAPARKLSTAHINWAASARGELVLKPGVSTTYNLRFTDLSFSSSGTFKVCFCDHESADGDCDKASDFLIEVGKVHVSGVHCLLTVPKLRATKCYEQYYGGLSCADELPVVPASAPLYPTSYGTFPSP